MRHFTVFRVVQTTHHQSEVRFGASRGIQCSRMSLVSVGWTLFKYPGLWDKCNLDYILGKGDHDHGHNIMRIFDVLPNFPFATSEMKPDY